MRFLVTGGAGYIGSHMVKFLLSKKHKVTIYDNLSSAKLNRNKRANFKKLDLLNLKELDKELSNSQFDAVFHFAALSVVSESERKSKKYYNNNVIGTKNLIKKMIKYNINNFVFSSSASVYGKPNFNKISENFKMKPISNYGKNKKEIEIYLTRMGKKNNLKSISFRYFNAAGADETGELGEDHNPETHLIPKILKSISKNKNKVHVYGNNYKTKDGTCIRDYIHVMDLAKAHSQSLNYLFENENIYLNLNIGTGIGTTVLELVKLYEKVNKCLIPFKIMSRRKGDVPKLVAESTKARTLLNWYPKYSLNDICKDSWNWILLNPQGYLQ